MAVFSFAQSAFVTELITPKVFEALTSAVLMEHTRRGQVSFSVEGHYYTFLMDRASLQRLARQIEIAIERAPTSRRRSAKELDAFLEDLLRADMAGFEAGCMTPH